MVYYAPRIMVALSDPSVCLSLRLSVPWRICFGYRNDGCLQLGYRRSPEMCGLRTRPLTEMA